MRQPPAGPVGGRPDRIAMWAVVMAVVAMLAAAASSKAASGGLGEPKVDAADCHSHRFGERDLAIGDCGRDVATLNWLLSATRAGKGAPLGKQFGPATGARVKQLQRRRGLEPTGVADASTRGALTTAMKTQRATWYGPGFFGNETACGRTLKRRTVGVAHKRLPCGTKVTVSYGDSFLHTRVIDRGPYAHGAKWDLTNGARKKLGFTVTDDVRVAVVRGSSR